MCRHVAFLKIFCISLLSAAAPTNMRRFLSPSQSKQSKLMMQRNKILQGQRWRHEAEVRRLKQTLGRWESISCRLMCSPAEGSDSMKEHTHARRDEELQIHHSAAQSCAVARR